VITAHAHTTCPCADTYVHTRTVAPGQIRGVRRGCRRKKIVVPLHFFGSTNTICRFGERCRDGQYSLVSFLVAACLLTVPPCAQPCVKVGGGGTCSFAFVPEPSHVTYSPETGSRKDKRTNCTRKHHWGCHANIFWAGQICGIFSTRDNK